MEQKKVPAVGDYYLKSRNLYFYYSFYEKHHI